jgi:hypothetical protein
MTSLGGYDPFLPVDSGWFGMQIVFSPDAISWEQTTSGTRKVHQRFSVGWPVFGCHQA